MIPRAWSESRSLVFFISLLLYPSSAAAAGEGPVVETVACPELDAEQIRNIVMIELKTADYPAWDLSGLRVTLTCNNRKALIEARDPLTKKSLNRRIALGENDDANRVVALAVFQLYKVSWMELLVSTPAALDDRQSSADTPKSEDLAIARTVAEEAIEEPPRRWTLAVGAGGRLRSLGNTVPAAHTQLLFGHQLGAAFGLHVYSAFDFGEAHQQSSDVQFYGWALGGRLAGRLFPHRLVAVEFGVTLSGGYSLLKGSAKALGLSQHTIGGFTGEGMLHFGPGLAFDALIVTLELEGGYGIKNPVGSVAGDDPVTIGGFLIGAALKLNFRFESLGSKRLPNASARRPPKP